MALAALNFTNMDERGGVFRVGFREQLELFQRLVELVVGQQRLAQSVEGVGVAGVHVSRALVGRDGVLRLLHLVVSSAQSNFHFRRAVGNRDGLNDLNGVRKVTDIHKAERNQIQHHFFRIRLNGLGGLELIFSLFGLVLHGVKLAQDHAVFHIFRLQRHDLLKLRNGLVQHVAGGRCGRDGVVGVTQLAQINAAEQLVRVDVAGVVLSRPRAVISASCTWPVRK